MKRSRVGVCADKVLISYGPEGVSGQHGSAFFDVREKRIEKISNAFSVYEYKCAGDIFAMTSSRKLVKLSWDGERRKVSLDASLNDAVFGWDVARHKGRQVLAFTKENVLHVIQDAEEKIYRLKRRDQNYWPLVKVMELGDRLYVVVGSVKMDLYALDVYGGNIVSLMDESLSMGNFGSFRVAGSHDFVFSSNGKDIFMFDVLDSWRKSRIPVNNWGMIRGLAFFRGALYVGADKGIYSYDGKKWTIRFKQLLRSGDAIGQMHASEDYLLAGFDVSHSNVLALISHNGIDFEAITD